MVQEAEVAQGRKINISVVDGANNQTTQMEQVPPPASTPEPGPAAGLRPGQPVTGNSSFWYSGS